MIRIKSKKYINLTKIKSSKIKSSKIKKQERKKILKGGSDIKYIC